MAVNSESERGVEQLSRTNAHLHADQRVDTQVAVEFNDRYDASAHDLDLTGLPEDLSALGERLAVRLELEDGLVQALLDGADKHMDG